MYEGTEHKHLPVHFSSVFMLCMRPVSSHKHKTQLGGMAMSQSVSTTVFKTGLLHTSTCTDVLLMD